MGRLTDIDYDKLLLQLLPVRYRKPRTTAWLKTLTSPITNYLYGLFKNWELKSWYDIKYQSGAVTHLEYVLNDLSGLDPEDPEIIIGAGSRPSRLFIPLRAQNDPVVLGVKHIYKRMAYLYGSYDFKIIIHTTLHGIIDEELIRAIANRYKRDSKQFIIRYETF